MIFHCFRKFGIGVFRRERDRYGFHAIGFAGISDDCSLGVAAIHSERTRIEQYCGQLVGGRRCRRQFVGGDN